jgi:hypothetical protein
MKPLNTPVAMSSAARQGMDPHNERKVFKELVSAATGAPHTASQHLVASVSACYRSFCAHSLSRVVAPPERHPLEEHSSTLRLVACRRGHAAVLPADAKAAAGPALHAQRQRAANHERSPHPCELLSSRLQWANQHACK